MKDAWDGLRTLTGEAKKKERSCQMYTNDQTDFSNKLNDFYCRFERNDLGEAVEEVVKELYKRFEDKGGEIDFEIHRNSVKSLF